MFEKKKKDSGSEKRLFPRLPARNLIKIKHAGGGEIEKLSNISDISEGGLRIVCHDRLPIGTELDIQVNVPEKQTVLNLNGKVVWVKEMKNQKGAFFAGVAFTGIKESDRNMVRELIQTRLDQGEQQVPED